MYNLFKDEIKLFNVKKRDLSQLLQMCDKMRLKQQKDEASKLFRSKNKNSINTDMGKQMLTARFKCSTPVFENAKYQLKLGIKIDEE